MHSCFKINNTSFSEKSITDFIQKLLSSDEVYLRDVGEFLAEWYNEEEYVIVETSGSTGVPKAINLYKKHMINSALATGEYFSLKENSTVLLCLSASYIAGKMMLVRALTLGWHIYLKPPTSTPLEGNQRYDFAAMVPLQVANSLPHLNKVKKIIIGGAPISKALLEQLQSITAECFMTYGMTETCTHIAIKPLNTTKSELFETLPNITISQDERSCLVIMAPNISNDSVTTNDIVKLDSNKSFQWIGRFDTIINSGGVKLFPEQIEQKLSRLIKQRFFVTGIPDEFLGEKLILVIESETVFVVDNSELEALLLKYEIPKKVMFLSKFNETPTGKIHRSETLKLLASSL